jgi:hypothetical protein
MLAQVFNPTETKKNGPARMPASTPARRSALPFTAASAVLPATSQKRCCLPRAKSYGDARGTVNGDPHRWCCACPGTGRFKKGRNLNAGRGILSFLRRSNTKINNVNCATQAC